MNIDIRARRNEKVKNALLRNRVGPENKATAQSPSIIIMIKYVMSARGKCRVKAK